MVVATGLAATGTAVAGLLTCRADSFVFKARMLACMEALRTIEAIRSATVFITEPKAFVSCL
jgi:hypothetical protein